MTFLRSKKYYNNLIIHEYNLNIPFLGLVPMTKTKTILGISLAAVFAVSMIAPAIASDGGFLTVIGGDVTGNPGTYLATIDASTDIPRATSVLGGYGWFTGGSTWAVFAITTHNAFDSDDPDAVNDVRDSRQNPDSWHAHLVNVDENACITAVSDVTTAGIAIVDGDMSVKVPKSKIDGSIDGQAAGFHIVPSVAACNGVTPLALQVQFT